MADYLNTDAGTIHYRDYGGVGEPIVLVHGLGGSVANWDAIAPRLTSQNHVVALDLPGFGLSPPAPDWRLATHARSISAFSSRMGGRVTLMGNSLGGLLSEIVASSQPNLVGRLVLISPATPPRLPDPRIHWPTAFRLLGQATPILGKRAARFLIGHYEPDELVKLMMDSTIYEPSRVAPDIVEQFVRLAEKRRSFPWAIDAIPLTGRSIAQFFVPPRRFVSMIRNIKTPTLVVQGIEDRIVSPTAVEWLCSLRPDWTLIQLADTGHTPQLDAPIRLLETIKPWLESNMMSEITA